MFKMKKLVKCCANVLVVNYNAEGNNVDCIISDAFVYN